MSFNRDPLKQTQAVLFSRKHSKTNHPVMLFNNNLLQESSSQKQLGIVLDHKINFEKHLRTMSSKVNKTIDLIRKLREILPRQSILTIYKTLLDHILTMKNSYSTKVTMFLSIKNCKFSNKKQH